METTKTSLSSQLVAAKESISDTTTWIRGWLGTNSDGSVCMCAHGAAQAQCNPFVRTALNTLNTRKAANSMLASDARASSNAGADKNGGSTAAAWTNRPSWIKNGHPGYEQCGGFDLHFILGMVGLTVKFNDAPTTTHKMVMDKFDEAIGVARQLESLGLA